MAHPEKSRNEPASPAMRNQLLRLIAKHMDGLDKIITGGFNGYGIDAAEHADLRDALSAIMEDLLRTPFKLVQPEVFNALIGEMREAADRDHAYLHFKYSKLLPLRLGHGWNGNAKLRREVEELYKPEEPGKLP